MGKWDTMAYRRGISDGQNPPPIGNYKFFLEPKCSYSALFVRSLAVFGAMYCHGCYFTWLPKT